MNASTLKLLHPAKICVPVAVGLAWGNDGFIYQEKLDGVFSVREIDDHVLAGECVSGEFYAFDCLKFLGNNLDWSSASWRLSMMNLVCIKFGIKSIPIHPHGGKLLAEVLARGGEGVVRKNPASIYTDPMTACKRLETWIAIVTECAGGSQSAAISIGGKDAGKVALRGGKIDQVRVGSMIKVEGMGLHPSGKIREPRTCKDTPKSWLVQY